MFIFTAWKPPMHIHMPSTQTISLHYTLAAPLLWMANPSQHTFSHVELNFVTMHVGVCVFINVHLSQQLDQGSQHFFFLPWSYIYLFICPYLSTWYKNNLRPTFRKLLSSYDGYSAVELEVNVTVACYFA
jgi:hypothetical protein